MASCYIQKVGERETGMAGSSSRAAFFMPVTQERLSIAIRCYRPSVKQGEENESNRVKRILIVA